MSWSQALLPTRGLASGRLTTALVATFVFLAGCTFAAGAYVNALIGTWNRGVSGTVTVQLPPISERQAANERANRAVAALRADPEVARADVVSQEAVAALLKPWLVDDGLIADLPLPTLIDVELKRPSSEAAVGVGGRIARAVPGAVVDDHRAWLARVVDLADAFRYVAVAVFSLITAALAMTVVFATRASLAEATDVVDVLHLVGARDGYIAMQFARRAAWQSLRGGFVGVALLVPALAIIVWLGRQIDPGILPEVTLPWTALAGLAFLPLAAMMLSALTAHVTVRRNLATVI